MSERAGRYIKQITGYRAFVPQPLPPSDLDISGAVGLKTSRADLALGRLDGAIQTLPNPKLFTSMYVRREAVLSSQIEGTQASLDDLVAAEAKVIQERKAGDVSEVSNYVAALNLGLERLKELPMSSRLMREIHARLMDGTRGSHATPGQFRTSQNWIGHQNATLSDALFVPPPPDMVGDQIGALETFLHSESDLPLLVRIALAHAQFETIHPFVDGNGRLGRLLITFLLCEHGVLSKPVLYVSLALKKRRREYYERLQAVRDLGAWEEWLVFFLECVAEAAEDAARTVHKILILREQHMRLIIEEMGSRAAKALKLLEGLYDSPFLDVGSASRNLGVSFVNANNIVSELERLGVLLEVTNQKRNRVYMYDSYLALFRDL